MLLLMTMQNVLYMQDNFIFLIRISYGMVALFLSLLIVLFLFSQDISTWSLHVHKLYFLSNVPSFADFPIYWTLLRITLIGLPHGNSSIYQSWIQKPLPTLKQITTMFSLVNCCLMSFQSLNISRN